MYSRKAWGGGVEPYILAKFVKYQPNGEQDDADPVIAAAIFEYSENELLGKESPSAPGQVCVSGLLSSRIPD